MHTRTHTNTGHICTLSNLSPCLIHLDHLFYFIFKNQPLTGVLKTHKTSLPQNIQKLLGTRTGPMYYSNHCQGSLLIIYVDILIMAGENGWGGYIGLQSCMQPQISAAHFYYFSAAFHESFPQTWARLPEHTQPTPEVKVAAVIKLDGLDEISPNQRWCGESLGQRSRWLRIFYFIPH